MSANERLAATLERLEPGLSRVLTTMAREKNSAGTWTLIKRSALSLMFALGLLVYLTTSGAVLGLRPSIVVPTVAQVDIQGPIEPGSSASADALVPILQRVCREPNVRGLVLHVNSPGGSPGDAERIGAAVDACKDFPISKGAAVSSAHRRVVCVIDGLGASAAYMIALHADEIVANPTGMVGSIGAIITGLKYDGLMQKVGISQFAYASGPLKSMLSPYAEDTPEQKAVAQELALDGMAVFKEDVVARRQRIDLATPDLWSGRVWIASQAKQIGLIDQIGLLESVEAKEFPNLSVQSFEPPAQPSVDVCGADLGRCTACVAAIRQPSNALSVQGIRDRSIADNEAPRRRHKSTAAFLWAAPLVVGFLMPVVSYTTIAGQCDEIDGFKHTWNTVALDELVMHPTSSTDIAFDREGMIIALARDSQCAASVAALKRLDQRWTFDGSLDSQPPIDHALPVRVGTITLHNQVRQGCITKQEAYAHVERYRMIACCYAPRWVAMAATNCRRFILPRPFRQSRIASNSKLRGSLGAVRGRRAFRQSRAAGARICHQC